MADVFEDETEHTVSIQEYLKDVEEQELEADLVLGGDEGKECTYSKGYMKRQAIFSCLTCTPDGNAGVCTACSLSCHDGHEIVELWTKRNFRCDCGNSKFGEFYCKLVADREPVNSENSYNQNFKGAYCTCHRPYPDPDVEEQVEMIQCCICEDWLHENHLGFEPSDEIPRDEEGEPLYEEFICVACAKKVSFLSLYPPSIWAAVKEGEASTDGNQDGVLTDAVGASSENVSGHSLVDDNKASGNLENSMEMVSSIVCADFKPVLPHRDELLGESSEKKRGFEEFSRDTISSPKCALGLDLSVTPFILEKNKPMFLSKVWRDLLCRCEKCIEFYTKKGIRFLIEKEDSIGEYEKMGKQKRQEKLQQEEGAELNFLNKLGHVEKIEILSGIADMKNELCSFLRLSIIYTWFSAGVV
ncbi:putative E3 ubiquitin-protein ligase UBR7 isoform X2 [Papaver somniferum]|uniref:putative E3 ubiquitin-protein ligase UBR7 isoform X2 n=1 Tax=Papaver somniferum TaxID=3469 RepID=UPI000E705FC2|nr:putative E3 ubiquitin-protein ligase UBR7 isoform X2 [Papaver somniferum]